MTIYIDEIFAVNLLMDGLVLWATSKLMQRPIPKIRLLLAVLLGAGYGVVIFLPDGICLANGIAKAVCALIMIWIAFGWGHWRAYLKAVIYLYLVSFAVGGSTIALMYFGGQHIVQTWSGIALVEVEFHLFWLLAGALLIFGLVHFLHNSFQKKLEQSLQIVSATVRLREKQMWLRLLVDSGNCLTDPISGLPVVVVELQCVRALFTDTELQQMNLGAADAAMYLPELAERIRLLPFQTVGYRGLMLGVRLDELQIQSISKQNVVMALSPQQFAADGSYQGIISPLLL